MSDPQDPAGSSPAGAVHESTVDDPSGASTVGAPEADRGAPRSLAERFGRPSIDAVVLTLLLVVAVRVGLAPLQDNSFLTHLATGRLILDDLSVPTADPFSWTAAGSPWTVQSWLASVVYAGIEDLAGLRGVRVLGAALAVALTVVLWKLTEPGRGVIARAVPAVLVVLIGSELWVERPYMFGAVGLALTYLAAERRLDPRWLVPIMWVWANTHGSFPFGPGLLVLLAAGRWLDERSRPDHELRCLLWAVVGTLVAVVGPLGLDVLTFPFTLLQEQEAFENVREWQPVDLGSLAEVLFAVQLLLTLVALVRLRSWRATLPAVVFAAAGLMATRNILQASIVLTPVIALGLRGLGRVDGARRPALARPVVHALAVVLVVTGVASLVGDDAALEPYPREAVAWMHGEDLLGPSSRVVSRDLVGNYIEYEYGPDEARVSFDDRVDMYPIEVVRWHRELTREDGDYARVLSESSPTAVLWDGRSGFGRWLVQSPDWEIVWTDRTWLVAVPEGSAP